jgi:hypothetical protein
MEFVAFEVGAESTLFDRFRTAQLIMRLEIGKAKLGTFIQDNIN